MPSTTRGSILISTANDIGEALVEKLGGVGYSPNEWKEKYNLCGIAPVDSAPALSVLADSAGTGDERGSILIATADAIGAILNKKYSVLRGFKPKEWASACRKMKALEEGSVASSPIASFSDGADDVPTKSLIVTIPPTLTGVSSVTETQIPSRNMASMSDADFTLNGVHYYTENGVLYIDGTSISETSSNNNAFKVLDFWLPSGTYYFSRGTTLTSLNVPAYLKKYDDKSQIVVNTGSFTLSEKTHLYIGLYVYQKTFSNIKAEICINLGSTAITYEDTEPMTQYLASLGRTIYGGTADIVNGEGTDNTTRIQIKDRTWTITEVGTSFKVFTCNKIAAKELNFNFQVEGYENAETYRNYLQDKQCGTYNTTNAMDRIVIRDDSYTTVEDFLTAVGDNYIVFENTTPTDFTFDGQEIPTRLGYNAFWSDSGNTAVEYYQAPTPYARKTATGGIANFSDQRTDLPLTKAIANIAPSIAGKSAVNLYQGSEQYQPTTTYTAELGETVYGGSVDFVSGEVKKTYGKYTVTGQETGDFLAGTNNNGNRIDFAISDAQTPLYSGGLSNYGENKACLNSATWTIGAWCIYSNRLYIVVPNEYTNFATALQYLLDNNASFAFPLAAPTESTIPGRVISPIEGVNNYWNDAGGDTEIQYFENEA